MKSERFQGNQQNQKVARRFAALRVRVALVALAAVAWLMSVNSWAASPTPITQLQYIQLLVQLTGDTAQLPATSNPSDYIKWAQAKGLSPKNGWDISAKLTREVLAETMVQLLGIVPKKNEDQIASLARLNIKLPDTAEISREDLTKTIDQYLEPRLPLIRSMPGKEAKAVPAASTAPKPQQALMRAEEHKETICHKGHTITVGRAALEAHLAHGDTVGPCVVTEVKGR
jgi:hypothetical protein